MRPAACTAQSLATLPEGHDPPPLAPKVIGLAKGDHIIAINSRTVRSPADVAKAMARKRIGSKVRVVVVRSGHLFRFDDAKVEQVTASGSRSTRATFGAKLEPKQVTLRGAGTASSPPAEHAPMTAPEHHPWPDNSTRPFVPHPGRPTMVL